MGEPTPLGKFLGCDHKVTTRRIPAGGNPSKDYSENDLKGQVVKEVKCIEYDMESFMSSCVDRYCELAKITRSALRHVETPFIDEPKADKEWRTRIIENCDRVAEGKPPLPMPASKPELVNPHGQLHEYAARVLMKILYGARLARKDLLRAIGALATFITKWDKECDKKLLQLVSYINSSLDYREIGWVGNSAKELLYKLFADADFAGDSKTYKSTNGCASKVVGSFSSFVISGVSKKQTCVSHSTPESELVAADFAVRTEGLPLLDLLDIILHRKTIMELCEDNETCAQCIKNGHSPAMRYIHRTHGVDMTWLHERIVDGSMTISITKSKDMAADIFTKHFLDGEKWREVCSLINVMLPGKGWKKIMQTKPNTKTSGANAQRIPQTTAAAAITAAACVGLFPKRCLIEFCCGENSRLGNVDCFVEAAGCTVHRITVSNDVLTDAGRNFTLSLVDKCIKEFDGCNVLLWGSIPCTGGSQWTKINAKNPLTKIKIDNHVADFHGIWDVFRECLDKIKHCGGFFCNEWPTDCM